MVRVSEHTPTLDLARFDSPRAAEPPAPLTLFDAANIPEPVPTQHVGSIEDNFREFHHHNPWVYDALVTLARDEHHRGADSIGIGMLYEVLRWQYRRATRDHGSDFKLNNNYRSRYARLIMDQEPDLVDVFQTREITTP